MAPPTIFKFRFSPPARLVHFTSELCGTGATYQEVDLSKTEHLATWFLDVNPARQVPAMEQDGTFMAESRDICRLFLNTHKVADHWYPENKRAEVDEWLDWCKPLHLYVEKGVVMSHTAPQPGYHWRESAGLPMFLLGLQHRADPTVEEGLKFHVAEAEAILAKRSIGSVQDLNIGDVATILEVTLPMECHPAFSWDAYPALKRVYGMLRTVPEFEAIDEPFLKFARDFRQVRDSQFRYGLLGWTRQVLVGARTVFRLAYGKFYTSFLRPRLK
jgi:glutathione S-transferase